MIIKDCKISNWVTNEILDEANKQGISLNTMVMRILREWSKEHKEERELTTEDIM
jgi:predicted HicB family RNase H-like nuclease